MCGLRRTTKCLVSLYINCIIYLQYMIRLFCVNIFFEILHLYDLITCSMRVVLKILIDKLEVKITCS